MIDRIVELAISTPRMDKLVLRIMVVWVLVIVAWTIRQLIGG